MNNLIKRKALLFAVLAAAVSIWQLAEAQRINAQTERHAHLTEQELKLRNELEKDSSFKTIPCRKTDNETRLMIYNAANSDSKNETVKVKKVCNTIEGDLVPSYLTVNQRKITLVVDTSRDEFSSMRLYVKDCQSLTLGTPVMVKDEKGSRLEFKPVENSEKDKMKDKVTFALRCETGQKPESMEWVF